MQHVVDHMMSTLTDSVVIQDEEARNRMKHGLRKQEDKVCMQASATVGAASAPSTLFFFFAFDA